AGAKAYPPYVAYSSSEWQAHYGPETWKRVAAAKRKYDPAGVLTPGPGIFERREEAVDSIVVSGLTKGFRRATAVDDLSLRVAAGRFFGFLGPNGAGKSTTMKMLTGLLRPTRGEVVIEGIPLAQDPLAVKRVIGVLPEELFLYERLT